MITIGPSRLLCWEWVNWDVPFHAAKRLLLNRILVFPFTRQRNGASTTLPYHQKTKTKKHTHNQQNNPAKTSTATNGTIYTTISQKTGFGTVTFVHKYYYHKNNPPPLPKASEPRHPTTHTKTPQTLHTPYKKICKISSFPNLVAHVGQFLCREVYIPSKHSLL